MSKPNEDRDVYYIPPNFLTSGRLFGGMIRARNAIEACVLVLLTGVPIIKLPFSLTTRIIILCLVSLPLGIFGVIGFEGDSLSEFAVNWVRWLIHRRTLYRSDTPVPEAPKKPMKAVSGLSAPKPPEQLGIKIKEKPKKRKKRKPVKKPHKASKYKSSVAKKKQPLHAEDFIPVKDIRNGIIETTDGRYLRVIEVEPINFLLRNISEQKNIVASFASWMKISPVKVQIKVLTKKADIGKHLNTIEREMEAEDNPKCRDLQLDYYHLIQAIGSREAITRRFLVIFEYYADRIMKLSESITEAYVASGVGIPTDSLLTKILLGTVGCVPAYDRYFKKALADTGAAPQVFSAKSIRTLGNLYLDHEDEFEKLRKHCGSRIEYPAAKILDMCFFEYGFQRDASSQEDSD